MYHFQKSLNPNYKTLHITLAKLYKNNFKWTNYGLEIKVQEIKNFNKWSKNIYLLSYNLNLSNLEDVSTPLQKRKNEFHLLNMWFMILLS
jgi:hypothetical protein